MAIVPSNNRPRLADYSADYRMLILAAMATVAGTGGAFSAWVLLKLIAIATNILWYGSRSYHDIYRFMSQEVAAPPNLGASLLEGDWSRVMSTAAEPSGLVLPLTELLAPQCRCRLGPLPAS